MVVDTEIYILSKNKHLREQYMAQSFVKDNNFPLQLLKCKIHKQYDDAEEKKAGFDPNAINLKLVELVRMVHGNTDAKHKIIDDFNEAHPECSKNSIERKLKESFIKDKR